MQRNRFEIFNSELRSCRNYIAKLVELAHCVVEDGCDNSTVAISGRTGVALVQPKPGNKTLAFGIKLELEVHSFWIVFATGKAVVFLKRDRLRPVSVGFGLERHKPC